jgi:hypothetical protein
MSYLSYDKLQRLFGRRESRKGGIWRIGHLVAVELKELDQLWIVKIFCA